MKKTRCCSRRRKIKFLWKRLRWQFCVRGKGNGRTNENVWRARRGLQQQGAQDPESFFVRAKVRRRRRQIVYRGTPLWSLPSAKQLSTKFRVARTSYFDIAVRAGGGFRRRRVRSRPSSDRKPRRHVPSVDRTLPHILSHTLARRFSVFRPTGPRRLGGRIALAANAGNVRAHTMTC